jgi:hypothetical protein
MRLLNYIREHRRDPRTGFPVIIIRRFSDVDLARAGVGNSVIRQGADELFSQFEARVCAAARSAATHFVIIMVSRHHPLSDQTAADGC